MNVKTTNWEADETYKLKKIDGVDCRLAIGSIDHIVEYAQIIETNAAKPTIHNRPLQDGNVRVSIYKAIDKEARLPFPVMGEMENVGQAIGSIVAWLKDLVVSKTKEVYLYDVLKKANMLSMIGFVDPALISANGCGNVAEQSRKLADGISKTYDDQIFLIPCNHGKHWTLTVVNPNKRIVYFMDPLRHQLGGEEWKLVVDNGLKIFNTEGISKCVNLFSGKSCQVLLNNQLIKSGYFVMRYMKDIIEDESSTFMTKREKKMDRPYTQQEIDVVRCEWADF